MPRRKLLNVVATTALAVAFPACSLFADEPTPLDAAPQAVASDAFVLPDLNDAFADFNVSLFDIPVDEPLEFYQKRVDDLEREWKRVSMPYVRRLSESLEASSRRASDAPASFQDSPGRDAYFFFGSPNNIPTPSGLVAAPADSVPARYAAALASLLKRLADSAELSVDLRYRYYCAWTNVAAGPLGKEPLEKLRSFYEEQLAVEKAKSPLDLRRVYHLRESLKAIDREAEERVGLVVPLPPFDRAAVEKLLDVPQGESVDFYAKRSQKLTVALRRAPQKEEDRAFISKIREAQSATGRLWREAALREADALDVDAAKKLLDVPRGESAAFYRTRYQETQNLRAKLLGYCNAGADDLGDLRENLGAALPTLAKRLAYADDLDPFERFDYFKRWIGFCGVEELRDALDAEIARDATSDFDLARRAYVEYRLLDARLTAAIAEARKDLPPMERSQATTRLETSISPKLRAVFDEIFYEIAERADDGALPWPLGETWSKKAEYFAIRVDGYVGPELATRLRKEVCAALADSEDETDRRVVRSMEPKIRANEFIDVELPVAGQTLDGKPFDWASYRGVPVLIEIARLDENGGELQARVEPAFVVDLDGANVFELLAEYEKAGLRRVSYLSATLDAARKFAESAANADSNAPYAEPFVCSPQDVAPENDWTRRLGVDWKRCWILVDKDGCVLATIPRRPAGVPQTPEIVDVLKRLFPNVSTCERK
ncbi:MAG: hypothetical protein IKU86_05300 [Thermoguttaceae bacterium]|nr:hypothetical protein [Thermoguttaceae bacterium]